MQPKTPTENSSDSDLARVRVSIILPAYNAASFIANAIESALAQTLRPHEIIIVDDASSDGTAEVASRFAGPGSPVKLIRRKTNGGPGAARNAAIEQATGDWIAVLDADDRYLPDRLQYLVTAAVQNGLDLAADNYYRFDFHAGQPIGTGVPLEAIGERFDLDRYSFVNHCMTAMAGRFDFGLLKPIVRRDFLLRSGIRYREDVRHAEDFLFYLQCLVKGAKFSVFPEPHYLYTLRFGSISQKYSGLSRTTVNYAAAEADTRALLTQDFAANDPKLAKLLTQRADSIAVLRKFVNFRFSLIDKHYLRAVRLAILDRQVIACLFRSAVHKCATRWRKTSAKLNAVRRERTAGRT